MENHCHVVVETPEGNLVAGMKWFLGTRTACFNRRYKLFGHLFSGRYKVLLVDATSPGCCRTCGGVVSGDSVLCGLMLYRSEEYPAAWSYLSAFRKQDTQPPPEDDALRLTLKRHLLVQETAGGDWTLRVPLMLRWLREQM